MILNNRQIIDIGETRQTEFNLPQTELRLHSRKRLEGVFNCIENSLADFSIQRYYVTLHNATRNDMYIVDNKSIMLNKLK